MNSGSASGQVSTCVDSPLRGFWMSAQADICFYADPDFNPGATLRHISSFCDFVI